MLFAQRFSHGFENLKRVVDLSQFHILVKYSCKSLFCFLLLEKKKKTATRCKEAEEAKKKNEKRDTFMTLAT